jgi:ferric-dicitrate binding protein FerR (iron transport regulator)
MREVPTRRFNGQTYEEACEWFVQFRAGEADAQARREFDLWLRRSPECVRAYLEISAIWSEAPRLDPGRRWDLDSLIAAAAKGDVIDLPHSRSGESGADPHPQPRRHMRRLAAACVVLCVGISAVIIIERLRAPMFETTTGEQRFLTLTDGSTVNLNSQSAIEIRFTSAERGVVLSKGEALFHVAKNAARPFIVSTGGTRVRAVGTEFDVYRKSAATIVSVLEGRVEVSQPPPSRSGRASQATTVEPLALTAGYRVAVTRAGIGGSEQVDAAAAIAWTQQQLIFDSASAADVAEEFNRYNSRRMIIDGDLAGLRLSGVFSSTDPMAFVRFLQDRFGVNVVETDTEIRVAKKRS